MGAIGMLRKKVLTLITQPGPEESLSEYKNLVLDLSTCFVHYNFSLNLSKIKSMKYKS
jgi:hypothetical protein